MRTHTLVICIVAIISIISFLYITQKSFDANSFEDCSGKNMMKECFTEAFKNCSRAKINVTEYFYYGDDPINSEPRQKNTTAIVKQNRRHKCEVLVSVVTSEFEEKDICYNVTFAVHHSRNSEDTGRIFINKCKSGKSYTI